MTYKELRNAVCSELRNRGNETMARKMGYAENRQELHSCLREYVFFTDAKTDAFLKEITQKNLAETV